MSRNGDVRTDEPDLEVVPMAKRRQFTTEEKLWILEEADACAEPGEIGALVRQKGIFSSHLSRWRRSRGEGQLTQLSPKQRGPKPATDAALVREAARLQRENERLQKRLGQAETIIDIQKNSRSQLG
jgi:transposase